MDLVGVNMLFIKRRCGIGKVREAAKIVEAELKKEEGKYPEWILVDDMINDLKAAWDTNLTIRDMMRESLPAERRLVKLIVKRDKLNKLYIRS